MIHFKDNKNKSALSTRWAQMSKQEQIIEKKKMEIQAKLEAQKQAAALAAQAKLANPTVDEETGSQNIFSNDGSFMSQYKALLDKQNKETQEKEAKEKQEQQEKNEDIKRKKIEAKQKQDTKPKTDEYPAYEPSKANKTNTNNAQYEKRGERGFRERERHRRWNDRGRNRPHSPITPVVDDRKRNPSRNDPTIPSLMQLSVMPSDDRSPPTRFNNNWNNQEDSNSNEAYDNRNSQDLDLNDVYGDDSSQMDPDSDPSGQMGSMLPDEMGHGLMGPGPMGPGPLNMGPMGPLRFGPMGPGPIGPGPMGPGPMGPGPMGPSPMGPGPMSRGPMSRGPMGPGPMNLGPMGGGPMGPGPMGTGPMGPGPMVSGPMRPGPMGRSPMGPGPMGPGPMGSGPMGHRPMGPGSIGHGPMGGGPMSAGPIGPGPMGARSMGPGPIGAGPVGPEHMGQGQLSLGPNTGVGSDSNNSTPNNNMGPSGSMPFMGGPSSFPMPSSFMGPNGPGGPCGPGPMPPNMCGPNMRGPGPNGPVPPFFSPFPNLQLGADSSANSVMPPNTMNNSAPLMGPKPPFGPNGLNFVPGNSNASNFGSNNKGSGNIDPSNIPFMPPIPAHPTDPPKPLDTSDGIKPSNIPPPPLMRNIPPSDMGSCIPPPPPPPPSLSKVLSADTFPPSVRRAASEVAANGDHWENVLKAIHSQDQTMWFLHNTNSSEYKMYKQLMMDIRTETKPEINPDDKYEPEFCLEDDDSNDNPIKNEAREGNYGYSQYGDYGFNQYDNNMKREQASSQSDEESDSRKERRKRKKSRWGNDPPVDVKPLGIVAPMPPVMPGATLAKSEGEGLKLSNINRNNQALMQYAMTNYGTTNLSPEDWKKCEDNFKLNLLYQDMLKKRQEVERLANAGKHKYEYDSDEDTSEGTWEHKLRAKEMNATERWATELTKQAAGKHHIGDFLPPEELKKFMENYSAVKSGKEPDLSDYKEYKLKEDNVGFKMLQKLGWNEGEGLGAEGTGIVNPINKSHQPVANLGLGAAKADSVSGEDDEFDAYRKRMMLAYRFRPNPLNNPRRPYY